MSDVPERIAWFHCFAGIAGDMALGSLIDAGADTDELRNMLARLPVDGWRLDLETVMRGGLSATRALVTVEESGISRTYLHIVKIIEEARLPTRVRERALSAFRALAEVEGQIHARPATQVHFHELGGHDTIIDIVGTAAALELLEVDVVRASPVATGRGMVRSQHGLIPNPAPAVIALLEGAPVYGRDIDVELTTPTGAAILATMGSGFGPIPAMTIEAYGYGAGGRDIDGLPNCTQVVIGSSRRPTSDGVPSGQPQMLLEANLDDITGEQVADVLAALFEAGAADAWITPVLMKKGRPGQIVSALCDVALGSQLRLVLLSEGGSLGVRSTIVDRFASTRTLESVVVDGQPVRVKVSPGRAKVEHDDAARAAKLLGLPVREVTSKAEAAWRDHLEHPHDH
ncbi:MAG TPA: nickel pincer cofactor biosynthesis protein LarC [Acidimicrobiales bacterium]